MKFFSADEYQEGCLKIYFQVEQRIRNLLPNIRVEHIGASSIEGAISKGDLDIFIGVEASVFESSVQTLLSLDFKEKQNTLRTEELCMLESSIEGVAVALQVVANDSEFESFIVFRDKVRSDINLLNKYNQLKLSCRGFSPEKYRRVKSKFIEHVLTLE